MAEEEKAGVYLSHLHISGSSTGELSLILPLEFNSKVIKGLSPGGVFMCYLYIRNGLKGQVK